MCDIISFTDENKMFHGGFSVDSFLEQQETKHLIGGGKKPSSSTLHNQEFAVPGTMFFIPAAFGGGKKYDEPDKEDQIVDDELYDKLLGTVELKSGKLVKNSGKQTKKNKEIGKNKTRKQKL